MWGRTGSGAPPGVPAPSGPGTRRRPPARRLGSALLLPLVLGGWVLPAGGGHELPFYPSYYPQEIAVETLRPAAAAAALARKALHAYLGPDPWAGRTAPEHVPAVESLGSWVLLTFRAGAFRDRDARCAAARAFAGSLPPGRGDWVQHPSAVTPHHADFLHHADRIQAARPGSPPAGGATPALRVQPRGALAAALLRGAPRAGPPWDAVLEEVGVEDLLARARTATLGWLGPPWIKQGWFHAWLLQAGAVSDPASRGAVEDLHRRLTSGAVARPEERLETERALVARLAAGCERPVLGYTLRRERINADYSAGVENVARDALGGLDAEIFVRTVKLKDFPWNGWLRVGVGSPPAAAWNPVAGFTDPAGRLVWHAVGDPALFPEPYNADWLPNRVRPVPVRALEGGPVTVPADALVPEPGTGILRAVGEGRSAAIRLRHRVLTSPCHDGTRLGPADLLYALGFAYRWGAGQGPDQDPHVERATALLRHALAGVRLVGVETDVLRFGEIRMTYEVPVLDVYLRTDAGGPDLAPALAPPWTPVPWHVLALMEEAVRRGVGAFSAEEARRRGVPWLDLVRHAKTRRRLGGLLDELERRRWVPPALVGLVTAEEAGARWAALRAFAAEHGHYLVTGGPYRVRRGSAGGAVLEVFRDFGYPMGVGTYDPWAAPLRAWVARATVAGRRVEISAEVEWVERFGRERRLRSGPLGPPAQHRDRGPVPVARYLVLGADGSVLRAGTAEAGEDGRFRVDLEGLPGPGPRTLLVALAVQGHRVASRVATVVVE